MMGLGQILGQFYRMKEKGLETEEMEQRRFDYKSLNAYLLHSSMITRPHSYL
jgi:hypothetical protein